MNKIRQYFSTFVLIRGFAISILASSFIYFSYLGLSFLIVNTFVAILSLYLLLQENHTKRSQAIWLVYGFGTGVLWFWWISLSFQHYGMFWATPISILLIGVSYGAIFWFIAYISDKISFFTFPQASIFLKSLALLSLSYLHPFTFDWLKPELMFMESYLGIEKLQFASILLFISLSISRNNALYLLLIALAYQPSHPTVNYNSDQGDIRLITTDIEVKDKWNEQLHEEQFKTIFGMIDKAINDKKKIIILPESIFPVFLNHSKDIFKKLQKKAKDIVIVTGGLYWDGKTPKNSTYIFANNKVTVANKVILVPFGESNPLPKFMSDWVNRVFYDGAVDYEASSEIVSYELDGKMYTNAICFEATSEKLYERSPKNMIVISNNGWFVPSTEPTLQRLLLLYYSQKYKTNIYHSINKSNSYTIKSPRTN